MIGGYSLDIARGAERDYTFLHSFGENPSLVSGTQTIWSQGGLYPWSAWDSGVQTLYAISTSTSDTAAIRVYGLDSNWLPQQEDITLTGTTAVASTKQFLRVNRVAYLNGINVGTVTVRTVSGAGTVVAAMAVGLSQSTAAIYTIPAGYNGYGTRITVGVGKGGDAEFQVFTRQHGQGFQVRAVLELYQSTVSRDYTVPVRLPPKTDIDFRAKTSGNNYKGTGSFDLILDKR